MVKVVAPKAFGYIPWHSINRVSSTLVGGTPSRGYRRAGGDGPGDPGGAGQGGGHRLKRRRRGLVVETHPVAVAVAVAFAARVTTLVVGLILTMRPLDTALPPPSATTSMMLPMLRPEVELTVNKCRSSGDATGSGPAVQGAEGVVHDTVPARRAARRRPDLSDHRTCVQLPEVGAAAAQVIL